MTMSRVTDPRSAPADRARTGEAIEALTAERGIQSPHPQPVSPLTGRGGPDRTPSGRVAASPYLHAPSTDQCGQGASDGLHAQADAPGLRVQAGTHARAPLEERELVALWLLGRVPEAVCAPWVLLRPGRAGRGPGPDVREAAFLLPSGVVLSGDVEVHLLARDFARHGHAADPAYAGVVRHLVWHADASRAGAGEAGSDLRAEGEGRVAAPVPLAGGGFARTVAVAPQLDGDPARLRALVRLGPSGHEPCAEATATLGVEEAARRVRHEGHRRLAERTWQAVRLAAEQGWDGAWARLLDAALTGSAGRRQESAAERSMLAAQITSRLGGEPVHTLAALAATGAPRAIIEALRPPSEASEAAEVEVERAVSSRGQRAALGAARAAEIGWNAVLPLLGALAAAYGDTELARATARLVAVWPAPRPYGRTRELAANLGAAAVGGGAIAAQHGGALAAQGLLHLQDLWCERGCCGQCPVSPMSPVSSLNFVGPLGERPHHDLAAARIEAGG